MLDVLVGRQRQVCLPYRFALHFAVLRHLVQHFMVFPRPITGQTCEVGVEIGARTLLASEGVGTAMLLTGMFAPRSLRSYLQGALQLATSKSLRRTSQYIPHSSGRDGTNLKPLQTQFWQAVLNFLPKKLELCVANRCPQKHLDCLPSREHSDFLPWFQ